MTAKDVAREIGVSQATVSRAFTKDASISPEMRRRVMQAAERMGYKPNAMARTLITRRSGIVGIVMGDLTNPFYPEVLELLSKRLRQDNRQTLLFNVPPGEEVDHELPLLMQYQVDAVIITSAIISSAMAKLCAARGIPVVLFNRYVPGSGVHAVSCDNYEGGRLIARYLVERGHRRLVYVAGKQNTSTTMDRERGFTDQLAELGLALWGREDATDYTHEQGREAALRLLRGRRRPDAIFFANDIMAIGGLDAIRDEVGMRVPEDVSVVGFDDIQMAGWPSYSLTTVRQPIGAMVEKTAQLLDLLTRDKVSKPRTHFIPGELVERSSCRDRRR
ncbi:MAG: LacI family DNA-binding transcriptional regulator [Rhodospirillaceae bacterium]|nr:LacI family DNA-binding transcriptional regulator [Rhodospirillaceae bacterium]